MMRKGASGRWLFSLCALLILVASAALSGCSAGSTASNRLGPPVGKPDGISIALTGEPSNLDFTKTAGAAIPQALMYNVYEGLVKIDQQGQIQPLLAKSWTLSEDRKTYTFALQPNVKFANGAAFTADTVKFSIERVKSPAWVSSLKKKMDVVAAVDVLNPLTARVTLAKPSNAWLYDMGTLVGAMFDPGAVNELATQAIGTGPFQITQWNRGASIEVSARPDYWGSPPGVRHVSLRYFADAIATTNALQSGDVDVVYNMQSPDMVEAFAKKPEYQVIQGTSTGKVMLSMNNKVAPFNDVRVRQAVMYAIDRQAVIDTAWSGFGTKIGAPVPPTDPFYEDLNSVYPYDPAKARQLLADAGVKDLKVTFSVPTRAYAKAVSEIVISQLADVGITATIQASEFPAVWLDKVFTKHDYQMSVILAVESRDLLTMFNNLNYYLGYDNSKIKDLAAQADAGTADEYEAGMKKIVRIITEDAAADTLFLFPNLILAKAEVTGIPANSTTEALELSSLGWKS